MRCIQLRVKSPSSNPQSVSPQEGLAQAKAVLGARAAVGTQAIAELLQKQAELGTELSEKLKARAQEFSALAGEVQESVGSFAADTTTRATGAKKAA